MFIRRSNTLHLSRDEEVKEILADMRRGDEIVLRVTGNSYATYTRSYSLAGLEEKVPTMKCFQS